MTNSATVNRISLPTSVIGTPSRLPSGALQTLSGKKVTIGPSACTISGVPNRIVIPQQQQQPQSQTPPTLQSTIPISFALASSQDISRIVSTTSANLPTGSRITQSVPTSVARITNMSLHALPLTPARANPVPLKVTPAQNIPVQLKTMHPSQQPQPQQQPPAPQLQSLQQQQPPVQLQTQVKPGPQLQPQPQSQQPPTLVSTSATGINLSNYNQIGTPPPPPLATGAPAQYLQYYSIDNTGKLFHLSELIKIASLWTSFYLIIKYGGFAQFNYFCGKLQK